MRIFLPIISPLVVILQMVTICTTDVAAPMDSLIEATRKELQIPGCAVVVVHDDRVVLLQGFGVRDVQNNLPVTPDTRFAIGSCSKAFTAMLGAIAADAGKFALDDHPRKYLPWFKLVDAEIDANVTLRDMLSHRTGLLGTDLLWITGTLSRDEVIRAVADAKPTAKLREKWQYQNVMYSAAGQAIAAAEGSTWEALIDQKIFSPLGMSNSDTSVEQMQKSSDFSRGYAYDVKTKSSRLVPTRDLTNIAPAGAINASARDMAEWVRLMLGEGQVGDTRIVSRQRFKELVTGQIDMTPGGGAQYALGWAVTKYKGHTVWEHAGGIDGFNAFVTLVPEKRLGYVLLTNVTASPLDASVRKAIFAKYLDEPVAGGVAPVAKTTAPAADPKTEVGKYGLLEIEWKDEALWVVVPGQPRYKLVSEGGRKYRLDGAPPGFFATFRDSEDGEPELWLEQPHGNMALAREPSPAEEAAQLAAYDGPNKDLLGTYSTTGFEMRVTVRGKKVVALGEGQPQYTLTAVAGQEDAYSIPPAPSPDFELRFARDPGTRRVTGVHVKQPQGDMQLQRTSDPGAPVDVEELLKKVIAAAGGEENLRRHATMTTEFEATMENQGVTARGRSFSAAPSSESRWTALRALDREIGTTQEVFDGRSGGVRGSFLPAAPLDANAIEDARVRANFYGPAGWKDVYESIIVTGSARIDGQDTYVVALRPRGASSGAADKVYISKEDYRIVRRERSRGGVGAAADPVVETYSDFKEVQGVVIPMRIEQQSRSMGRAIVTITSARFDEQLPADAFKFDKP